jgi:hypothetical protein
MFQLSVKQQSAINSNGALEGGCNTTKSFFSMFAAIFLPAIKPDNNYTHESLVAHS